MNMQRLVYGLLLLLMVSNEGGLVAMEVAPTDEGSHEEVVYTKRPRENDEEDCHDFLGEAGKEFEGVSDDQDDGQWSDHYLDEVWDNLEAANATFEDVYAELENVHGRLTRASKEHSDAIKQLIAKINAGDRANKKKFEEELERCNAAIARARKNFNAKLNDHKKLLALLQTKIGVQGNRLDNHETRLTEVEAGDKSVIAQLNADVAFLQNRVASLERSYWSMVKGYCGALRAKLPGMPRISLRRPSMPSLPSFSLARFRAKPAAQK